MILDTTLREGVQSRLWRLTDAQRMALARDLARAGVREIEAGCAGRDPALPSLVRTIRKAGARALVWCPTRPDLVDAARAIRPDAVCLSIPVSEIQLRQRLRMDRTSLLASLEACLGRLEGCDVVLGLEDASRAAAGLLEQIASIARRFGVRRLRIADTLGLLDPSATARLVRWLGETSGLHIGFNGHDDFGMATANAVAALDAGAESVDASLMGWGERAGIASLETLAAWLVLRRGEVGPDPRRLLDLARRTARHAHLFVPETRAIVGSELFRCGSGLHVEGIRKDPSLYEPFDPSRLGLSRKLEYGSQTGKAAVRSLLAPFDHPLDTHHLDRLVETIRARARHRGKPLTEKEVLALSRRSPSSAFASSVAFDPSTLPSLVPSRGDSTCP